ncbi:MAG: methyltransferase domain-containing protein [Coriobacteriia bacterium]|nr:methyltransferase domain-containing protein [Coriobacteriia bacterium]
MAHSRGTEEWYSLLACPDCGGPLVALDGVLRCEAGHSFDVARQGYVNLLRGGTHTGTADSAGMVAARAAFLGAGHYAPLMEVVAASVALAVSGVEGCILDAGAGTGEYLAAVLDRLPGRVGLALDISKHAARRAARAHERVGAVVCDAWGRLPVRDGAAAAVLSVFAPRNPDEFARVLAPGGALVVVTPTMRHLSEIVGPLGMVGIDPHKQERLQAALSGLFECTSTCAVEREVQMSRADAIAAAQMGPSAYHTAPEEVARLAREMSEPVVATLSVTVGTWCARSGV